MRWHYRISHPEFNAFERLVNIIYSIKIQKPIIIACEIYAFAKIKRQNRRIPRAIEEAHGERIAVDFHPYLSGINGYTLQMLLTCRKTGMIWNYYLVSRTFKALINAFRSFFAMLKLQYSIKIKIIKCNNKITEIHPRMAKLLGWFSIKLELSFPNTQDQNGAAERSGGIIKDKERAMRIGARLPH
jgi:hypothetical protein